MVTRRNFLKLAGASTSILLPTIADAGKKSKYEAVPFEIPNAMWSWWTKPIVMRDFGKNKNKTYLVFTETAGAVGLAIVDHSKRTTERHIISTAFTPDDHNAGCIVTGNNRVAVFMQGRNIIDQPGNKMLYVEFKDGENPTGLPLKSFDLAIPPNRSNYPNVYNSRGELFALSRNQQALGEQWNYVLGSWPMTEFSPPQAFFASSKWTWPYFAIRRNPQDSGLFHFALGWHPFDGKHHDIYYGTIVRQGPPKQPWNVVSGGKHIGNMTTGKGLPFNEDSFEKVYVCPPGYSTRLFDVVDNAVAFAIFDPANHIADYRMAYKSHGKWTSYSVCNGGLPFHGTGIRNYYGGMAISERNKFVVTVAREVSGSWIVEEYQTRNEGYSWAVNSRSYAPAGSVFGRPMEEVLSEESCYYYDKELISASWYGQYDVNDYTKFNTTVKSTRSPTYKK